MSTHRQPSRGDPRVQRHHPSAGSRGARGGRRGNYASMFVFTLFAIVGFGALAIDISYQRMTRLQVQDAADAASQAALIAIRRTGDVVEARLLAEEIIALNPVAGRPARVDELTFGVWTQPLGEAGSYQANPTAPNAVRVRLVQDERFLIAPIIGFDDFRAVGSATSASRNLHAILSVDITNSWTPANFAFARQASERFLEAMRQSAGPYDKIGMNVWTGRYGWEFTPLTRLRDVGAIAQVAADWSILRTASKPGLATNPPDAPGCSLPGANPANNGRFENPPPGATYGGCYPHMPREYLGLDGANCTAGAECGTDHSVGVEISRRMFAADPDDSAFRALIFLTDGQPNGLQSDHGAAREVLGFEEDRWPEYRGPVPRSTAQVRSESIAGTAELWNDMRVHTWVVSFVQHDAFMPQMVQGQGYYENTSSAQALVGIFQDIANTLPLAIVE